MESSSLMSLLLAFVLLLLGSLFSMGETSLLSISKLSIRQLKDDGNKKAKLLERLTQNKENFLSAVLIGNNLVTVVLATIATTFAISISTAENEAVIVAIATAITTFVVIIFGDIIPKYIASRDPARVSLFVARPISFFMLILSPISKILNFVFSKVFSFMGPKNDEEQQLQKEQEFKTYIDMSLEEGVLPEEQGDMLEAVVDFSETVVQDVMTPRVDIIAVGIDYASEDILEIFDKEKLSRLPVYDETIDNIVGILHFRDFILDVVIKKEKKVRDILRTQLVVPEHKTTDKLFAQMKKEGVSMSIVVDEYGGIQGLVTFEDLVETVMGDIFDEHDLEEKEEKENEVETIIDGEEYIILGSVKIQDMAELIQIEFHSEDYDTMAGYVLELFDGIPSEGDEIKDGSVTFIIEQVEKNRIISMRMKIERAEVAQEDGEE